MDKRGKKNMKEKEKKRDSQAKSASGIMTALGAVPLDGTPPPDVEALGELDKEVERFPDLVLRREENKKRRRNQKITLKEYQREGALILREAARRLGEGRTVQNETF